MWVVLLPFLLFSRLAQVFGEVTEQRGFSQVKLGLLLFDVKTPPRSMQYIAAYDSLIFTFTLMCLHILIYVIETRDIQCTVYNIHPKKMFMLFLSKSMTVAITT